MPRSIRLVKLARELELGVTFHRAFDQCKHPQQALEDVIALGCERILTSGLASNALDGASKLAELVEQADGRISIMAGAGVNANNVATIITTSQVQEVHLSGKSSRSSKMHFIAEQAKMGADDVDDFAIPITSSDKIRAVTKVLNSL